MILVTGSTGRIGRDIVFELVLKDIQLRAMIHNGVGNEWLHWSNIETVMGDFAKPATLDAALDGIETAFLISSPSPKQVELQNAFVDACVRAGVKHLVKVSALGATADSPCRFLRWHAATEAYANATAMRVTTLRPNSFFSGILQSAPTIAENGTIVGALDPATAISTIDTRDIAAVAAQRLLESNGASETLELTGPQALTQTEIAAAVAHAIDRPIAYKQISFETYERALAESRVPAEIAAGVVELQRLYAGGDYARVTPTVEQVTGRPPAPFDAYLQRVADKLAPSAIAAE